MEPRGYDSLTISARLKNALVADLVMGDLGDAGSHWLTVPLKDTEEWTEHFARQLGIRRVDGPSGLHETLLLILLEVDRMLTSWPSVHDLSVCRALAPEATKHLSAPELVGTLLAGPKEWHGLRIEEGCRIDGLAGRLQPILEKALASALNRVIDRWVEWDIRQTTGAAAAGHRRSTRSAGS